MNSFENFEEQDFGSDFIFESDPHSLARILDNRELSPRSVLAMRMSSKLVQKPTLSPAKGAPKHVRENPEKYDFFQSKKGDVFWRPKTPRAQRGGGGGQQPQRQRALGRVKVDALPQRQIVHVSNDPRTTMSSRKPLIQNKTNKGRRSCMPQMSHFLPPPRQSISERKAVPGLDQLPSRLPRREVRKGLHFDQEEKENVDENSKKEEFDNFAKPLPVAPKEDKKSVAKMIMMRESLAGLPRASLSGLFRQSLSIAELDRMFEDDSTQSFEDLERRLKTPGKSTTKPKIVVTEEEPSKPVEIKALSQKLDFGEEDEEAEEEIIEPPTEFSEPIKDNETMPSVIENVLHRSSSLVDLDQPDKLITLCKSSSMIDLSALNVESEPLKSAVEALAEHRTEQAAIEQQIQSLMEKSLKRREQFRAVWGVSPRSINQKRDLKTVINVQNVNFSGYDSDDKDDKEEVDKGADLDDDKKEEVVLEDQMNDLALESPKEEDDIIESDLFQQMIEVNFPEKEDVSYAAHNFTGIDLATDTADLADISVLPITSSNESIDDPMDIEDVSSTLNTPPVLVDQLEPVQEQKPQQSLLQAALQFKSEMIQMNKLNKSKKKSVRFAPEEVIEEEEVDIEEDEECTNTVTVNIGGFHFSENGFKAPLVHTPMPKKKVSPDEELTCLPTPLAMRDNLKKAQEALESLYADVSTTHEQLKPMSLFQD